MSGDGTAKLTWLAADRVRLKLKKANDDVALNAVYDAVPLPDDLTILDDEDDPITNASFVDIQQRFSIEYKGTRYHFVTSPIAQQQQQQLSFNYQTLLKLSDIPVSYMDKAEVITSWRKESGSCRCVKMYMREHLVKKKLDMDSFMNAEQKQNTRMYVTGPPGSGKTTFFLSYFTQFGLIVLYRGAPGMCEIVLLNGVKDPINVVSTRLTKDKLTDLIRDVVKDVDPNSDILKFCLFDGFRQNDSGGTSETLLSNIIALFGSRKVICVTSLAFSIKGGDGADGIYGVNDYMSIDSWSYEDYKNASCSLLSRDEWFKLFARRKEAASGDDLIEADASNDECDEVFTGEEPVPPDKVVEKETTDDAYGVDENKDDVLADDETNQELAGSDPNGCEEWMLDLLEEKFYYAGGSARFMFDVTMEDLLKKDGTFNVLKDRMTVEAWESFANLAIGPKTEASVSSVLQRLNGKVFPVSKYFLLMGFQECRKQLIEYLKSAATTSDIPALKGWVFEVEQLDIVIDAMSTMSVVSNKDRSLALPLVATKAVEYDGSRLFGDTSSANFVIKCTMWNQGCFDAAFFLEGHLVTVNFTISERHSLKVRYIRSLKKVLEDANRTVNAATHIGIVPDERTRSFFNFDTATDTGYPTEEEPLFELGLSCATKLEYHSLIEPLKKEMPARPNLGIILNTVKVFPERRGKRKR